MSLKPRWVEDRLEAAYSLDCTVDGQGAPAPLETLHQARVRRAEKSESNGGRPAQTQTKPAPAGFGVRGDSLEITLEPAVRNPYRTLVRLASDGHSKLIELEQSDREGAANSIDTVLRSRSTRLRVQRGETGQLRVRIESFARYDTGWWPQAALMPVAERYTRREFDQMARNVVAEVLAALTLSVATADTSR